MHDLPYTCITRASTTTQKRKYIHAYAHIHTLARANLSSDGKTICNALKIMTAKCQLLKKSAFRLMHNSGLFFFKLCEKKAFQLSGKGQFCALFIISGCYFRFSRTPGHIQLIVYRSNTAAVVSQGKVPISKWISGDIETHFGDYIYIIFFFRKWSRFFFHTKCVLF